MFFPFFEKKHQKIKKKKKDRFLFDSYSLIIILLCGYFIVRWKKVIYILTFLVLLSNQIFLNFKFLFKATPKNNLKQNTNKLIKKNKIVIYFNFKHLLLLSLVFFLKPFKFLPVLVLDCLEKNTYSSKSVLRINEEKITTTSTGKEKNNKVVFKRSFFRFSNFKDLFLLKRRRKIA